MPLFPDLDQDAIFLSRTNEDEPLASFAANEFELDGLTWATIEHYYQAQKFEDQNYQKKIAMAETAQQARKLGRSRFKRIRKDWKSIKKTMMIRGVYICARTHRHVYDALIESDNRNFIEDSNYDYYWGCGRDRRGQNQYGKVLMQVRGKLLEESEGATDD